MTRTIGNAPGRQFASRRNLCHRLGWCRIFPQLLRSVSSRLFRDASHRLGADRPRIGDSALSADEHQLVECLQSDDHFE
jgi:hypothetical protein